MWDVSPAAHRTSRISRCVLLHLQHISAYLQAARKEGEFGTKLLTRGEKQESSTIIFLSMLTKAILPSGRTLGRPMRVWPQGRSESCQIAVTGDHSRISPEETLKPNGATLPTQPEP